MLDLKGLVDLNSCEKCHQLKPVASLCLHFNSRYAVFHVSAVIWLPLPEISFKLRIQRNCKVSCSYTPSLFIEQAIYTFSRTRLFGAPKFGNDCLASCTLIQYVSCTQRNDGGAYLWMKYFALEERAIGESILYLGMNACYHSLFCLERIYPFHVLMLLCKLRHFGWAIGTSRLLNKKLFWI